MKIRRLPEEVISRIAAGEVIERPASVLKELLENSLDAGASKIVVEATGAGKKLLRVADDGHGMEPKDCGLALERHATSKITSMEDLDRLSTFGFRGEALFSIAAVSRVGLTSCAANSRRGWTIEAEGGKIKSQHEAPPVAGTVIEVRDLFYNTPARLKFLKSDAAEKGHLARVIEEAALAHPETAFTYQSEGRLALQFPSQADPHSDRSFLDRAEEVLGLDLAGGLLTILEEKDGMRLRALAAPVENLSPSRHFQFFFVNRRPVASRVLQQALYRAYEPFRSRDRHPAAVVFLEMPPDLIDVNVHPTKREVRFKSEREIYELIAGAFSSALLRSKGIPTIMPVSAGGYAEFRINDLLLRDRPSAAMPSETLSAVSGAGTAATAATAELDLIHKTVAGGNRRSSAWPRWFTPPLRFLGQIEQAYLVFDATGGLLVVDQHAAQERILFERYQSELEAAPVNSQRLIIPIEIQLPASQVQQISSRAEDLSHVGFQIEAFGRTTLRVTEAPAVFTKTEDLKNVVHSLLENLQSEKSTAADVKKHALATIACKAAVKAHDRLSAQEALRLVEDLKECKDGTSCPHGRPSMISLNRDELARRFKRPSAPPL